MISPPTVCAKHAARGVSAAYGSCALLHAADAATVPARAASVPCNATARDWHDAHAGPDGRCPCCARPDADTPERFCACGETLQDYADGTLCADCGYTPTLAARMREHVITGALLGASLF